MPPDLSDELREEVVLFIKRIETAGQEQTRPCSLSLPKIVISEWRLSTLSVIMNWPERIKTQPHEDRDNCFLPFDSKGLLRYDSEQ